jgi:hypothetical protein
MEQSGEDEVTGYIQSGLVPVFITRSLQKWLAQACIQTRYIEPRSPR